MFGVEIKVTSMVYLYSVSNFYALLPLCACSIGVHIRVTIPYIISEFGVLWTRKSLISCALYTYSTSYGPVHQTNHQNLCSKECCTVYPHRLPYHHRFLVIQSSLLSQSSCQKPWHMSPSSEIMFQICQGISHSLYLSLLFLFSFVVILIWNSCGRDR